MAIPESLAYKIRQFRNSGRVVKYGGDLFATPNWIAVLMGQEIWPERHDPLVSQRDAASVQEHLRQVRAAIRRAAEAAPRHEDYLARLCTGVYQGQHRGGA
jgi:tryptophan halogenase